MPDNAWIETVVARWELPLIQYAQRILGRAHDARDVVQDAFLRLCREDRSELEPRLVAWLFTVCRNGAIDRLRKEPPMHIHASTGLAEAAAPPHSPAAGLERQEAASGLLGALAALTPNQQDCIRLKFQQGLSYQQISALTGLSVGNVGYLIHVGLRALRERLGADAPAHDLVTPGAQP
jgi:RNA polymerase sigma-70 factor (ECF subfamily)